MNEFTIIPLENLTESKSNPRRRFDEKGLEELIRSVETHGVLVPLLVRPNGSGDTYEIIAGARRFRAAKKAGVPELPVRVKEMDDTQVLEVQVIENLQREDVHPLDEALGYQALLEKTGYDVPAIAAKVGKSESYVYQRLKLAELIPEAQKAFLEDEITAGHAILIARLQPADQKRALKEGCFRPMYQLGPKAWTTVGVRELSAWIQNRIHLDLNSAPWKPDDEALLPKAGPCTTCPKRTGYAPELFPDVKRKDTCTDPKCYREKLKAYAARRRKELKEQGKDLVELSEGWRPPGKKTKALERSAWNEVKAKRKACENTVEGLVVDGPREGRTIRACTNRRCKVHSPYAALESPKLTPEEKEKRKREKEKAKEENLFRRRLFDEVLAKAGRPLPRGMLELIASDLLTEACMGNDQVLIESLPWANVPNDLEEEKLTTLDDDELARAIVAFLLIHDVSGGIYSYGTGDRIEAVAATYDVVAASIRKAVKAELQEAQKKPKEKSKRGRKKKPVQTSAENTADA